MSFYTRNATRRNQLRNLLLAALVLVLLALLVKGWLVGRHVYTLWMHGLQLRALTQDPGLLLKPEGPAQLKADLASIEQALRGLRVELRPFLRPIWLPWQTARENLSAVDELMRVSAELAQAGQVASDGLQSIVNAIEEHHASVEGPKVQEMSEVLFTGLVAARPRFGEAAQQVGHVYESVTALEVGAPWSPLARIISVLEHYLQLGHAALEAAAALPTMLGETRPVHYLVLAQNNDELRATGGFITGIGLLTVERGKISQLTLKDSYEFDKFTVDHPFAPEPMQRYMGVILWVTRDGNWSPDFPTAAKAVEDLYHLENSGEIAGVVTFDMLALQTLIKAIGPMQLEGHQDVIDADNILQKLRESWTPPARGSGAEGNQGTKVWLQTHGKGFLGEWAGALMQKLQKQNRPEQLGKLLRAVLRAIEEKHILLYFHEPAAQHLLATGGWDGAMDRSTRGDYLLALDTNMGYNKVNASIENSIEYTVTLDQHAAPLATLTITYNNHSPAQSVCRRTGGAQTYDARTQGCYWNYLRLYVPPGSQLLAAEGVTETETLTNEDGKTVFATFFIVPAGGSRTVRFTYSLPDLGMEEYRLLVQKQAGTEAVPLKVRIVLPPGMRTMSAHPELQNVQRGVVSYEMDLRQDRFLVLKLRK